MGIQEYLQEATGKGASDLFIVAGLPLTYKINRKMIRVGDRLMPEDTRKLIEDIYVIAQERKIETLEKNGDDDFSFSIPNLGRFRVSTYRQRGSLAAVIAGWLILLIAKTEKTTETTINNENILKDNDNIFKNNENWKPDFRFFAGSGVCILIAILYEILL